MTDQDIMELRTLRQLQAEAILISGSAHHFPAVLVDCLLQRIADLEKEEDLAA